MEGSGENVARVRQRHDPYALEYGPTARKHSRAMSRYYAAVNRAIKRALAGKSRRRRAKHEEGR
jgi:formaldehyde-activating enzyme involved in methanogenesis